MSKRKFEDLSIEEKRLVMDHYYAGRSFRKICDEFNLKEYSSYIHLKFPHARAGTDCPNCGEPLMCRFHHRSIRDFKEAYCPQCGHLPGNNYCECKYCKEKRMQIRAQKEKTIADTYTKSIVGVDFSVLDTIDRVYLAVAYRLLQADEYYEFLPLVQRDSKMTPTREMDRKVLRHLINSHCFAVSPNSAVEAFEDNSHFPKQYDPLYVKLWLTVEGLGDEFETKLKLFSPGRSSFISTELLKLWFDLGSEECMYYAWWVMSKTRRVMPTAGCKKVFIDLLHDFSICQIFYIIKSAITNPVLLDESVRNSSDFDQRWLPCQLNYYARNARLGSLKLRGLCRPDDYEISELTYYLFNKATDLKERGFTLPPSMDYLL